MGCFYHPAVPSAALCAQCGREICAHCCVDSLCPGCRLGRAMEASKAGTAAPGDTAHSSTIGATTGAPAQVSVIEETQENRLLAGLCYPLWPVALVIFFARLNGSKFLRFNALQALAANALGVIVYVAYVAAAHLPVVGWQSGLVLPFLMPAWFVFDIYLGLRAYGGYTPRVPLAFDYASKHAA